MPYKDPDAKRANRRRYYAANRERIRAANDARRRADPAGHTRRGADWYAAHPEMRRAVRFANGANRRAKRWGTTERLLGRDVVLITGPCAYCTGSPDTWDHVVPLCRGGRNHVANLVPSCEPCNRRKGRA